MEDLKKNENEYIFDVLKKIYDNPESLKLTIFDNLKGKNIKIIRVYEKFNCGWKYIIKIGKYKNTYTDYGYNTSSENDVICILRHLFYKLDKQENEIANETLDKFLENPQLKLTLFGNLVGKIGNSYLKIYVHKGSHSEYKIKAINGNKKISKMFYDNEINRKVMILINEITEKIEENKSTKKINYIKNLFKS